ncbi:Zinc finger protein 697 [Plecturocebus cupreus]
MPAAFANINLQWLRGTALQAQIPPRSQLIVPLGFLVTSFALFSWMKQEENQGVCAHQDSEEKGMGSDFEDSEDMEGDPEEREMGCNPEDTHKREGHLELEMAPNPQDSRHDTCTGEEKMDSQLSPEALWEAEVGGSRGQEMENSLADIVKPVSAKNRKISRAWWCAPVIPATLKAEAGELLEPGRWRLQ